MPSGRTGFLGMIPAACDIVQSIPICSSQTYTRRLVTPGKTRMVVLAESALEQKPPAASDLARQEVEDGEDEETCGFCIFMKAGGCKPEFREWSKCVDDERKQGTDFTEECREVTTSLQNCMMSNKDYYKPVLEDRDMFVESKEKFDTATTSQSPQELENAPDSSEAEKEEPSDSPAGPEEESEETPDDGEQPSHDITVKTAAYDARFPSYNQARNCYTRYNEYHRCIGPDDKGEEDPECKMYQKAYRSICPMEWVNSWNEQRDAGTWPGKY
ncbi:hypothetical protein WJX82_007575 [Trebouxia sp. C0006]